jgi:hypothetical protein
VIKNNVLYREWVSISSPTNALLLVTPAPMRKGIMYQLHNLHTAGHLGCDKTLNSIRQRFYRPGMISDVERWCKHCTICARRKAGPGSMQHCPAYQPLECIAIDIMGLLPITENGNEYIMVIGDYFT